jgi:hypothetical protein
MKYHHSKGKAQYRGGGLLSKDVEEKEKENRDILHYFTARISLGQV